MSKNNEDKSLLMISRNNLMSVALNVYINHYPNKIKEAFRKIITAISNYEVENEEPIDILMIKRETLTEDVRRCIEKYEKGNNLPEDYERNVLFYENGEIKKNNTNELVYMLNS